MSNFHLRTVQATLVAALAIFSFSSPLTADVVVPEGLSPGDTYHLIFVTRDKIPGTSADITVYNDFAQSQAELAPSLTGALEAVTWHALASTPTVNARDNIMISAPIYLLDGSTKIADSEADLWDESIDAPINLDQFLMTPPQVVWTGTNFQGNANGNQALGTGNSNSIVGNSTKFSDQGWVLDFSYGPVETAHSLYAVSQQLTVPVPEPTGTLFLGFASIFVALFSRRRR